jgi:hypothetical protein
MTAQTPSRALGRALRTVVVPEELDALRGPLTGRYQLPHHLDASARHRYDFADEQWRELAYRTVLMEAGTEADVTDWLDKNALLALWPQLYLPPLVRQAWERRHPRWPVPAPDRTVSLAAAGFPTSVHDALHQQTTAPEVAPRTDGNHQPPADREQKYRRRP